MGKAIVVLVAIHARGATEIRHILLSDLDRTRGRLVVRRGGRRHTIILDELTTVVLTDWLRERWRRWPHSTNPHLFITQMTAHDPSGPPMSQYAYQRIFRKIGPQPSKLRSDRFLDEAHETEDPIHLMRVFGISDATAMKYLQAAHPHPFKQDPTQA